jgi:hypothetical protein
MLRVLFAMIASGRHDKGWPRFSLVVQTASSPQTHRITVRCQGRIDSRDARGPTWEGVQHRPLAPRRFRHA